MSLMLALSVFAMTAPTDYPPAPGSGGAECTVDAECGIPAANCRELRDGCSSMSGRCDGGHCVCRTNYYGCSNCHAKATLDRSPTDPTKFEYTTFHAMLDGSGKRVDECSVPHGGKLCQTDEDCGGRGGLCISQHCVCPDSWMCDDCTITLTDLLYGLKCGVAKNGGGACQTDADCHNGRCDNTGGGPAFCACNALYACDHCEHRVPDIVAGRAHCPTAISPVEE